ncbi:MAG TPA: cytochrome C oxidase subunit IV family protein [Bacteroidota bacterium]|nr:cytochrome C oxidase subunit IV family protein [Bacteroidota bacterium]
MTDHTTPQAHETHVVGYGQYILIWAGLMALTGATVAFAGLELGRWIIITALTIASIKGFLVLSVFMHLRFEDRTFRLFASVSGLVLLIFIVLTFFDYAFR